MFLYHHNIILVILIHIDGVILIIRVKADGFSDAAFTIRFYDNLVVVVVMSVGMYGA